MAWPLVVAGTCHLDDIATPSGTRRRQQGGSAVYFALAAARHAPVSLLGAVGGDAEALLRATLAGYPVDLRGLAVSPLPTYRWRVRHDLESGLAMDSETPPQHSAGDDWSPRLDQAAAAAPVLFVASLRSDLQLAVLSQSHARLVGADTMTAHISASRPALEAVMESADILFINHHELRALVPSSQRDWGETARSLCGRGRLRAVVLKRGSRGAALVTRQGLLELPAPAEAPVVDPTGAGDALAGGFLGACAAAERDDEAFFEVALAEGMTAAALALSSFGVEGLRPAAHA